MQYGYQKTQKLMLISSPLKMLQNNSCEKSCLRKIKFLTFITVCKSFRPTTFLDEFFALCLSDSNSASNFSFYSTYIKNLEEEHFLFFWALFANFKAKIGRNGSENEKPIL